MKHVQPQGKMGRCYKIRHLDFDGVNKTERYGDAISKKPTPLSPTYTLLNIHPDHLSKINGTEA